MNPRIGFKKFPTAWFRETIGSVWLCRGCQTHFDVQHVEFSAIGTLTSFLAQKNKDSGRRTVLIVGMLIGPQILGLINIKSANSALNQILLLFGAGYILFDGGASLRFEVLKQVWITIVVMATIGVVITALITGVAAYFILGLPWIVALLLGASLASTDPATLVPIFRQIHVRDRVAQTIISESAFNDASGASSLSAY